MSEARDPVFLDAVLRPNPPMSPAVLLAILAVVALMNIGFGALFVLRGAWPVTPFMGLDVALLAWAFHRTTRNRLIRVDSTHPPTQQPVRLLACRRQPARADVRPSDGFFYLERSDLFRALDAPKLGFDHGRASAILIRAQPIIRYPCHLYRSARYQPGSP